jgi:hypothetical protein
LCFFSNRWDGLGVIIYLYYIEIDIAAL